MKKTIVLPNKSHSVPRGLEYLQDDLKKLECVNHVGAGRFGDKSKYVDDFEWTVRTMDSTTHTIKIDVRYHEFEMEYWITVNPKRVSELSQFLNSYKPR